MNMCYDVLNIGRWIEVLVRLGIRIFEKVKISGEIVIKWLGIVLFLNKKN